MCVQYLHQRTVDWKRVKIKISVLFVIFRGTLSPSNDIKFLVSSEERERFLRNITKITSTVLNLSTDL